MMVWFGPPLAALPTTTSIRPKCAATCSASSAALFQVAHVGRHGQTSPAESLQFSHDGVEVLDPARRTATS